MAAAVTKAAGWEELPQEDVEGIDDYIRQIFEVDLASYSLRYAHSKKGDPSLPKGLPHKSPAFRGPDERLANYLGGLEAAMCDLVGLKQDFEADMASYCDDYCADYYDGY